MIHASAAKYGVNPGDVFAIARQESNFNPNALSPAGARGVMQVIPSTFAEMGGVDPTSVQENIDIGTAYYKKMLDQFGDPTLARAAYNAGPGAVQKYGGVPPYAETQDYVKRVGEFATQFGGMGRPTFESKLTAFREMVPEPNFNLPEMPAEAPVEPGIGSSAISRGIRQLGGTWANTFANMASSATSTTKFEPLKQYYQSRSNDWLKAGEELDTAAKAFPQQIPSYKAILDAEGFGETAKTAALYAYERLAENTPMLFSLAVPGGVGLKVGGKAAGWGSAFLADLGTLTGETAGGVLKAGGNLEDSGMRIGLTGMGKAILDFGPFAALAHMMGVAHVFESSFLSALQQKGFLTRAVANALTGVATAVPTEVVQEALDISAEKSVQAAEQQGWGPEDIQRLKETAVAASTFGILGIPAALKRGASSEDVRRDVNLEEGLKPPMGDSAFGLEMPPGRALYNADTIDGEPVDQYTAEVAGPPKPFPISGEETMVPVAPGQQELDFSAPAMRPTVVDWGNGEKIANRIEILQAGERRVLTQGELDQTDALRIEATVPVEQRTPAQQYTVFQARKWRLDELRKSIPVTVPGGFVGPLTKEGLISPIRLGRETPSKREALAVKLENDEGSYNKRTGELKPPIQRKILRLREGGEVTGFTTAKGSTYEVNGKSTTRTKSLHEGHLPTDIGVKAPSNITYYVNAEDAKRIGFHGALSGKKAIIVQNGEAFLVSWNAAQNKWGLAPSDKAAIKLDEVPGVGKSPIELWGEGGTFEKWHSGNPIAKVMTRAQAAPQAAISKAGEKAGEIAPKLSEKESLMLDRLNEKEKIEGLSEREYASLEKLLAKASGEEKAKSIKLPLEFLMKEGEAGAGGGMASADIERVIAPLRKKYGIPITIKAVKDFPIQAIEHLGLSKIAGSMGLYTEYDDGTREAFIVSDNIHSRQDAIIAYLHEVVGHLGVRAFLTDADIVQLTALIGANNFVEVQERIAELAENPSLARRIWEKVVLIVKRALKRAGFDIDLTEPMIRSILRSIARTSERLLREGKISNLTPPKATSTTLRGDILYREPFAKRVMSVASLRDVPGNDLRKSPQEMVEFTRKVQSGEIKPTIIVDMRGGKPVNIIEGNHTLAILDALGRKSVEVRTIERSASSPVLSLYRKVGLPKDDARKANRDLGKFQNLWEIKFGNWMYNPIQMQKRFGALAPESTDYLRSTEDSWNTKADILLSVNPIAQAWARLPAVQGKRLAEALFEIDRISSKQKRRLDVDEVAGMLKKLELSDEAAQLYLEVDKQMAQTLDQIEAGLKYNAARDTFDSEALATEFLVQWDATVGDAAKQVELLEKYKIPGEVLEGSTLSGRLKEIASDMQKLRNRNFFPHMRFGKNAVTVRATHDGVVHDGETFSKGQVVTFETYESEGEQKEVTRDYLKTLSHADFDVKASKLSDAAFTFLGMPPGIEKTIAKELELNEEERNLLKDVFIRQSPGRGFLKHMVRRRGVAGFNDDAKRVFATYMINASNHISRIKHYKDMQDALSAMDMRAKGIDPVATKAAQLANPKAPAVLVPSVDVNKVGILAQYYKDHFKYMMNPANEFAKLRALGYMWYLGAVPKSAVMNLSQVPLVTYPWLAERFGDVRAMKALVSAMPAAGKFLTGKGKHELTLQQLEVLDKLAPLLDESFNVELAGFSESNVLERIIPRSEAAKFYNKLSYATSWMFKNAEKFNRHVTAIAASKLALQNEMSIDQAYLFTKDAIQSTQFEYAKWDRPRYLRGKGATIFLFTNFMQQASFLAFGGHGKGTAVRFWLVMALAAGLQGLPFAEDLLDLIDWGSTEIKDLLGVDDPYTDVRNDLRRVMTDLGASTTVSEILMHGFGRYGGLVPLHALELMGIPVPSTDVSGSLGLGRVVPGLQQAVEEGGTPEEKFGRTIIDIMGPVAAIPYALWRSYEDTNPDQWKRWERAMPTVVKGMSKALRFSQRGAEEFRGGGERVEFDPEDMEQRLETIAQAFGFTPTRLSQSYELDAREKRAQTWYSTKRSLLLEDYSYARQRGNAEMLADVRKEIRSFNHSVPDVKLRIDGGTLTKSFNARRRLTAERSRGDAQSKMFRGLNRQIESVYPQQ
jgi:hypothetical protein